MSCMTLISLRGVLTMSCLTLISLGGGTDNELFDSHLPGGGGGGGTDNELYDSHLPQRGTHNELFDSHLPLLHLLPQLLDQLKVFRA